MPFRMEKVNAEIHKALSEIINNEVRNPNLDDCVITITEVRTSPDFSQSKVYISVLNGENKQKELLSELNKSNNFIRSKLASELNLKRTPKLVFEYDNSLVQGENILKILDSININKEDK